MTLRYGRGALIKLCVFSPIFILVGLWFLLATPHREPTLIRLLSLVFHNGWAALGVFSIALGGAGAYGAFRLLRSDLTAARATDAGLQFNTMLGSKFYRWRDIGPIGIQSRRYLNSEHQYLAVVADHQRKRVSLKLLDATPTAVHEWIDEARRLSEGRPTAALAEAAAQAEADASSAPSRKAFGRKGMLQ